MAIPDNVSDYLIQLNTCRTERGMSYQTVADASGLSKSTICRILNGQSDPTVYQLEAITAAVQYKPSVSEIIPTDFTQEGYILYLQQMIQRQSEDQDRCVRQLQSHYNMLLCQNRRYLRAASIVAIILMAIFILLFLYDFTHLDRGWIQSVFHSSFDTVSFLL